MIVNKDVFFTLQGKVGYVSFEQTQAWLEACGANNSCRIVYLVDSDKDPKVACWGRETSRKFFGRKLMIDGLSYAPDVPHKTLTNFFKSLTSLGYSLIEVSDIERYNPNFEIGIRRAGFVRPWGLSLCPMSIIVHLQDEFNFSRNWRRNVKKSRDAGNEFVYVQSPTLEDAQHYLTLFGALKERKGLSYELTAEGILKLLEGGYDMFFVKDKDGKYLSGRIEYPNGDLVYDTYAATDKEGIKMGAAYHIQEDIFNYYRDKGFGCFDYGRISPSADRMDDIFVAKSYSGGEPIGYNGQWVYFTNRNKYALRVAILQVLHEKRVY